MAPSLNCLKTIIRHIKLGRLFKAFRVIRQLKLGDNNHGQKACRTTHWFLFGLFTLTLAFSTNSRSEEVIFHDIRFMAADLIDEMVYQWLKEPPALPPTLLTLAEISAPIGVDSRFNDLVENRLYELVQKNPELKVSLIHCSACQQLVATSNSSRTIISRGIDQPEALAELLKVSPNTMGLSLFFEAREREVVLLAQVYELSPPQKLLWSKRLSTVMGTREALRETRPLVSLADARQMQNQILHGREPLKLVSRLHIHNFQSATDMGSLQPLLFAEQSLESEILPLRQKRVGLSVGLTSIRDSFSGWTLGGRYASLMFRDTPSLIHPDLYWFAGLQYIRLQGLGAAVFAEEQIDVAKLLKENEDPKVSLTAYQLGFEALIKHRFGLSVYVEYLPALSRSQIVAQDSFLLPYHGIGTAMVFQW